MMSPTVEASDVWTQGPRTDRAIELLMPWGRRGVAAADVRPRHRYTRSRTVLPLLAEAMEDSYPAEGGSLSIEYRRDGDRGWRVTVELTVGDGYGDRGWVQEGEAWSLEEECYDPVALAACRALLQYQRDDGEAMTPSEVIAMLETRWDAWQSSRPGQASSDG